MIGLAPLGRIFLRRQPTDMRKSFDGLSGRAGQRKVHHSGHRKVHHPETFEL